MVSCVAALFGAAIGQISYKGHRFPPSVTRHAVFLYFSFTLSLRDVEEMLAWRGINVAYETIRCWANKSGPQTKPNLKRRRQHPSPWWHLDEMVCSITGERWYLWRAADDEGVVLDRVMQRGRCRASVLKPLRKLLRNQSVKPELITTDGLAPYGAALDEL